MSLCHGLESCVVVHIDIHLAVLTALGRDNNHTVSGTRTVDGSRRSILQHLDGLDVGRVERVEILSRCHTVNHVERVASVHRTHTTNANRRTAATRRSVGHDVNTCQLALHGVQHIWVALADRTFHVHHSHSTRQVSLALHLVTSDNHFCQFLGVVLQRDMHRRSCWHFHRLVTDERNDQSGTLFHLQGEMSLHVGSRTIARTFLHNSCHHHGLTQVVDDRTAGFNLLRIHRSANRKEQKAHEDSSDFFHVLKEFCFEIRELVKFRAFFCGKDTFLPFLPM